MENDFSFVIILDILRKKFKTFVLFGVLAAVGAECVIRISTNSAGGFQTAAKLHCAAPHVQGLLRPAAWYAVYRQICL